MMAYNTNWLRNLFFQREVNTACKQGLLTAEENGGIATAYPAFFYTPDLFIRIGLFILTVIIMCFSFGMISLIFLSSLEHYAAGICIFCALAGFVALEYFIAKKFHRKSGVDDALLWVSAATLFAGIYLALDPGSLLSSFFVMLISIFCVWRYADGLMAVAAFVAVCTVVFFASIERGELFKSILPFVLMLLSLLSYSVMKRKRDKQLFNVYATCFFFVEVTSLCMLYLAGNYAVVRELSNIMFAPLQPGDSLPFGFVFWTITIVVPIIYLIAGLRKKDTVLLRTGMFLIAGLLYTIRFYYNAMSSEIFFIIVGATMLILAWVVSRYLHEEKHGFTSRKLQATTGASVGESMIIAETLSGESVQQSGNAFGGGSFGGGGSSSEF